MCQTAAKGDITMSGNPHEGHRKRLRELYEKNGLRNFEGHNVLELLLFYCIPRKDTNEIAHALINRFGSFSEVLDAPVHELQKVNDVGYNTALFLNMIGDIQRYYQKDKANQKVVSGHDAIVDHVFNSLSTLTEEQVMLVCVDNKMNMICSEIICEGSVNSASLSTRAVISSALAHNAVGVILAHNHPRGYALPSREDLHTTKIINEALKSISVALVDHIICTPTEKNSLASCEQLEYLFM